MRKEIKTGLFAVIVLAATLFVVEYLRGKDIFSKTDTFYIIYPTVDGVDISTAVTLGGYQAGRVSGMQYNRHTMDYTVTVSVSREFGIPEDSRMVVYSSDIMGTRKIRIVPGHSATMAASGDTLSGAIETDMLSSLAESIGPVTAGLDTLITGLNRAVASVNTILDEDNRSRIANVVENLEGMSEDLSATSAAVRKKSPEIEQIITNLNTIAARLDSAAASAVTTVSNAEAITASLRDARLDETIDSVRALIIKLQDPSGSMGKLITTDSLHNSITRLANDLDSLVRGIEADPKKYIKISVF